MIFYFTGTGNSLYAANAIGEAQGERLVSIAAEMDRQQDLYQYDLKEGELMGFVFPVYAWAPPRMVIDFIRKLHLSDKPYTFSLCTCGDEEGQTTKVLRKALAAAGIELDSSFALRMPNNYITGFDVDSKEVEEGKLRIAGGMISEINQVIKQRKKNVNLNLPGKFPVLKTAMINPLFNRFALSTGKFYADDKCTACGLCEEVCPVHTIKVEEKPIWGKACTQCFACINRCPVHAIQMGKGTEKKGRYQHPDLKKIEETVQR